MSKLRTYFTILMPLIMAIVIFSACDDGESETTNFAGDTIINISAIYGVIKPYYGTTPVTAITETEQFAGTITWSPDDNPFEAETVYTATISLTAKPGYTLTGVAANFFTVFHATTVTNAADSGVITAVFPATGEAPPAVIDFSEIQGVTPPVYNETPVTTITETEQYTGTVSWLPNHIGFRAETVYTATITLTAKPGYTLTGITENFFTVAGAETVTNSADSGVVTAVFPATGEAPPRVIDINEIPSVKPPAYGETPVTDIENYQYTGTVSWTPADNPFDEETIYTATITLTPKDGYLITGVPADFFTIDGADTVSNAADSGVVTAVFPPTDERFIISGTGGTAGDNQSFTKGTLVFNMKYVPGGTFPTGTDDNGNQGYASPATISMPYWMAETEVTYELWHAVRTWAVSHGYTFANEGREGNNGIIGENPTTADQEPVTFINWRDAIVWCNALTEWYNAKNNIEDDLDCVYYIDSNYQTPLRSSTNDIVDNPLVSGLEDQPYIKALSNGNIDIENCSANGFRLPTSMEWECAARYNDGTIWTPGNYASGASDDCFNFVETSLFGVYYRNYTAPDTYTSVTSTAAVKSKLPNDLNLYDMSGNVWEWCFDWNLSDIGSERVFRGGCWSNYSYDLDLGYIISGLPYLKGVYQGFRFARTH